MRNAANSANPRLILVVIFLLIAVRPASAQIVQQDPGLHTYPAQEVSKSATVVLRDVKDDWNPILKNITKIHAPGVDVRKDEFIRLKAEANALKDASQANTATHAAQKTATSTPPTLGQSFIGNSYNNVDPADNSMAVSAAGGVLSAMNTRIETFSST
ncbi:MAG TPA: hypothetical protein ENJ82_12320, partial [Bacteroidetes bacterium]|nr:hypothetical protein [Bacteroidota bacterium]